VRIDEITTAEEQLEIVKMIFANTWTAFAQKAEEERLAQSKQARSRATVKKAGVKRAKPAPAARKPAQPQQAKPQTTMNPQMAATANAQQVHEPLAPITTTATNTNLSRLNGELGGASRAIPLAK
jgi:hypothetical protein